MPKRGNQKLKILFLMKMLLDETDRRHPLTMAEIINRLDEEGIKAERKSIYDDIELLKQFGLEIVTSRGKSAGYYIGSRDFEYQELTLLVDAVQSSKFLTEKKSRALIRKLESLTSVHEAARIEKQVHVAGRIKMQNESIYYNLDTIQRALAKKQRISFKYFDYDTKKDRVARKGGNLYLADPTGLIYIDDQYYLITYNAKHEDIVTYRVDRMMNITMTDEKAATIPAAKGFDVVEYSKRAFSMFDGRDERVELLADNALVNAMIDRFGKDVMIHEADEKTVRVFAPVTVSGAFFGWLAQYGSLIEIEQPKELREEFLAFLQGIKQKYTAR